MMLETVHKAVNPLGVTFLLTVTNIWNMLRQPSIVFTVLAGRGPF